MSKDFVRRLKETELIEFAKLHIVPDKYRYDKTFDESDESYVGIFFTNKWILGIEITEPIFVMFEDFGCSAFGENIKFKRARREIDYLQRNWKKFMIEKFGEKYVNAYKTKIKEEFEFKHIKLKENGEKLDKEEAACIAEIDQIANCVKLNLIGIDR